MTAPNSVDSYNLSRFYFIYDPLLICIVSQLTDHMILLHLIMVISSRWLSSVNLHM